MTSATQPTRWYTSDLHFGHQNIIALGYRPFSNIDEMHARSSLVGTLLWATTTRCGSWATWFSALCWRTLRATFPDCVAAKSSFLATMTGAGRVVADPAATTVT